MMTWTLWSLMWLSTTSEWGLVKHNVYTSKKECKKQELFFRIVPTPPSITRIATVCKEKIDT